MKFASKFRDELIEERDRINAILEAMSPMAPAARVQNRARRQPIAAPPQQRQKRKRTLSAAARNKIAAAQRKRWAEIRRKRKTRSTTAKAKLKTKKMNHAAEPKEAKAAA